MPTQEFMQLFLVPAAPATITDHQQYVDQLPDDDELPSPPPSRELVDSIRRWGVLEPLVVRAPGGVAEWGSPRALVAGRRRLKAVRILAAEARAEVNALTNGLPKGTILSDATAPGYRAAYERLKQWQKVPVRLLTDPEGTPGDASGPALTLLGNAVRRENPVADLAMIETLLERAEAREMGERQALTEISRATGLGVNTIKQRLRLRNLHGSLRAMFNAGLLSYTVALAASKLPPVAQERLFVAYEPGKTLTGDDVKAARKGEVNEVRQIALGDLFGAPGAGTAAQLLGAPPETLAARSAALVAQLRGTRLPICREAADLITALEDRIEVLEATP